MGHISASCGCGLIANLDQVSGCVADQIPEGCLIWPLDRRGDPTQKRRVDLRLCRSSGSGAVQDVWAAGQGVPSDRLLRGRGAR